MLPIIKSIEQPRSNSDDSPRLDLRSAVRRDLAAITERFEEGTRRLWQARTTEDREQAEAIRRDAEGLFFSAREQLADLFLLMLRCCVELRGEALRMYLTESLAPELDAIANVVANQEGRR